MTTQRRHPIASISLPFALAGLAAAKATAEAAGRATGARAGRWPAMALLVGLASLTSHSSALASTASATWAVAAALPSAPADGDVGLVLANPADAPVTARVSAADHRGVLLTDALDRELAARER